MKIFSGSQGDYHWISCLTLTPLLGQICLESPEIFHDMIVVVTAFDSGPLRLSEEERALGWQLRGKLAMSPRLQDPSMVPLGEFDEWYVYSTTPPIFGEFERFVNIGAFHLVDPEDLHQHWDPTWERKEIAFEYERAYQARFWGQLHVMRPQIYVAEGDYLNFASKTHDHVTLVERVANSLGVA